MERIEKINTTILWSLQGFLSILLIFQSSYTLPIVGIGHFHPLILHLPIGFGVLLVSLFSVKRLLVSFDVLYKLLLLITANFSTITAILGLFLAKDGGYETASLDWHQWSGVSVSFVYFTWVVIQKAHMWGAILGFLALIFAGHTGASITHGEDYLQLGKQSTVITSESVVFEDIVKPILVAKCESCHNDQKSKGALKMNSVANLLKGGKSGALWKSGDVLNSHLIQRIKLPINSKEHMPPLGKAQLTTNEITILSLWVKDGASFKKKLGQYDRNLQALIQPQEISVVTKTYDFSAASESTIESVNTPYCSVYPIANNSPALHAVFYVAAKFDQNSLSNLNKVSDQLVELQLSKMPINQESIKLISKLTNLERLNLNFTPIKDANLAPLSSLSRLKVLSLSGTKVGKSELTTLLEQLPSLKEIYVWDAKLSMSDVKELQKKFSKIAFKVGSSSSNEILQINPPILVNDNLILKPNEKLKFKHTLHDVLFRYTLNDSLPDSLSGLVTQNSISILNYSKVHIIATKPGWRASTPIDVRVLKSQFIPNQIDLLSKPDPKYSAKGSQSLVDFVLGAREVKGVPNFSWLGYKDTDFEALASFRKSIAIHGVTLSYLEKTDADIFPPERIEVWAGDSPIKMRLVASVKPNQPKEKKGFSPSGINIPVSNVSFKYYRIKAIRLKRLPTFVDNKGKNGLLRVDELLFY